MNAPLVMAAEIPPLSTNKKNAKEQNSTYTLMQS